MEMNIIMKNVNHFDMGAWCIITVCFVSTFTVDTQAILQRKSGFLFFLLVKCILTVKINPVRSSGFHGIFRIK